LTVEVKDEGGGDSGGSIMANFLRKPALKLCSQDSKGGETGPGRRKLGGQIRGSSVKAAME